MPRFSEPRIRTQPDQRTRTKERAWSRIKKFSPLLLALAVGPMYGDASGEPEHQNNPGISSELTENIVTLNPEDVEQAPEVDFYPAKELKEYLAGQTCFDQETLNQLIAKSIEGDLEGWQIEGELFDLEIELAQARIWQWLELVSGQQGETHINLQDRAVEIRKNKKMVEVNFSVVEQQKYIAKWLEENKETLISTEDQGVINYDNFISQNEEQIGVVRITQLIDENLPLGLVKMTSGYRSRGHQIRIIRDLAVDNGLLSEETKEISEAQAGELLPQLRALGVKVARPGASMHQLGLAADLRVLGKYEMLSGSEIRNLVENLVERDDDLSKSIFEVKQGIVTPVIHIECDNKFADEI